MSFFGKFFPFFTRPASRREELTELLQESLGDKTSFDSHEGTLLQNFLGLRDTTAADVMIPGDDPRMLADLIKLARRTERNFKQNLSFSILVTITLVYAVVNGFYDALWVGVLVHELSVILVILNGARLAEGTGTLQLVKKTFSAMWEATILAFDTGRKQFREIRS